MPALEDYWRAMRAIMYQPTEVWLVTDKQSERWLTDQFVMLKITEAEEFRELPDGAYKLTVSKGPEPREAPVDFDIDEYFYQVNHRDWYFTEPTMWSVIEEYNGKAQLWNAAGSAPLLGESTWSAIQRFYPGCMVEHSFRGNSIFRFSLDGDRFAYAAGIKIPEGQEEIANRIANPDWYIPCEATT